MKNEQPREFKLTGRPLKPRLIAGWHEVARLSDEHRDVIQYVNFKLKLAVSSALFAYKNADNYQILVSRMDMAKASRTTPIGSLQKRPRPRQVKAMNKLFMAGHGRPAQSSSNKAACLSITQVIEVRNEK